MKVEVKLTPEEVRIAMFNYVESESQAFSGLSFDEVDIQFDIEPPCNSQDPREYTTGGLRSVKISEK